jgi:hypothetical protein
MTKEIDVIKIVIKPDPTAPPFTFNPLKHHLGFIREFIGKAQLHADESETFELINSIGPQVTDVYCGKLSVDQLLMIVKSQLGDLGIHDQLAYNEWVNNSGKDYNFLNLPDGSKWTFRKGEKKDCYIHFHPARTNGSVRIRGTTLRTAMGLKIIAKENLSLYNDIDFINSLRQQRLQLSPIKSLSNFPAINKVLDLLNEDYVMGLRT